MSRSTRLKKYGIVYNLYMKGKEIPSPIPKRGKREDKKNNTTNEYQEFLKKEMKKNEYKDIPPVERMKKIAKLWERHKKKRKKR